MNKRNFVRTLAISLAAAGTVTAVAGNAAACGGEWMPFVEIEQIDYRPMVVRRAEQAIEEGRYQAAAGLIIRAMPHINTLDAKKSKIVARAQRVLAVATIRHDGALPVRYEVPKRVHGSWLGDSSADRLTNLRWSVASLRTIAQQRQDDPALETEIAEGLVALGDTGEGGTILEKLAQKDLISTPEGWAALAEVRGTQGNSDGKAAALKRCEAMAKQPTMCFGAMPGQAAS